MKYAIMAILVLFTALGNSNSTNGESPELYYATLTEVLVTAKKYTQKEIQAAERCVCGEAEGQSLNGKIAVMNVVQNRMERRNKTLLEVVYRKGQFDGMKSKRPITEECKKAVRMALFQDIKLLPKDVVYFHNKKIATDKGWIGKLGREKVRWGIIDDHEFFSYLNKPKA